MVARNSLEIRNHSLRFHLFAIWRMVVLAHLEHLHGPVAVGCDSGSLTLLLCAGPVGVPLSAVPPVVDGAAVEQLLPPAAGRDDFCRLVKRNMGYRFTYAPVEDGFDLTLDSPWKLGRRVHRVSPDPCPVVPRRSSRTQLGISMVAFLRGRFKFQTSNAIRAGKVLSGGAQIFHSVFTCSLRFSEGATSMTYFF